MIKGILFFILLAIIFSLGSALRQMLSEEGTSEKMMKSLAWRVAFSALFLVVVFALHKAGYIEPNLAPK